MIQGTGQINHTRGDVVIHAGRIRFYDGSYGINFLLMVTEEPMVMPASAYFRIKFLVTTMMSGRLSKSFRLPFNEFWRLKIVAGYRKW